MLTTLGTLRLYYFVAFGALGLYLPYFPSWLRSRGFVGLQMSAIVMMLPLCQLIAPSLVGVVADRWGLRGRMMTFCTTITALGMTALSLCAFWFEDIPFVLAWLCALIFSAFRGPSVGLADVLAMERAKNYGRTRLWGSLGFMVHAFVGGQIVDTNHAYQVPAVVAAVLWLLVIASYFLPRTSHIPPRPAVADAHALLKQRSYRQLLVTMVLIFGGMSAYDLCATMHLTSLGATGTQIGLFWTLATLAEVVLMFGSARLVESMGPGKALTLACATASARWLFLSQAQSLELILALQPLHAVSFGLMWISAIGVLKRELGEKGTATAHGLYSSSIAVGATLGLLSWGVLFERVGGSTVFMVASLIVAGATLSASRLIRLSPR